MTSQPQPAHSPLDERYCPVCEYDLSGIVPHGTCPECGGDTGPAARARAALAQAALDVRSRLILLASPGVAIVAASPALAVRGVVASIAILVLVVVVAGIWAMWRIGRVPGARRLPGRVVLLGSVLGITYFLSLICAAVLAVFPIALLARAVGQAGPGPPADMLIAAMVIVGCLEAVIVLRAVRWAIHRCSRHTRDRP